MAEICLINVVRFSCVLTVLLVSLQSVNANPESYVLTIADANWTLILQGEWMLKFYAPWCPACQHIQVDWETLAKQGQSLGVSVGNVDVTQEPGLSGRFLVTSLPTIFHVKDGTFRRYMWSRTAEDIKAYIVQKKWEDVAPLPGWKAPSSILMSGMAGLFWISVWIRQIHVYLTNTLSIPSWGSYLIFATFTLFLGLLFGLMLVLIADFCSSRLKLKRDKTVEYVKGEGSDDEDEQTSDFGSDKDDESSFEDENTDTTASPQHKVRKRTTQEPEET